MDVQIEARECRLNMSQVEKGVAKIVFVEALARDKDARVHAARAEIENAESEE